MRTLKKTLSLVLALVLCFGLVGTAFASNFDNYTDAEKVGDVYKEAVDVMIGTGIISGMTATEIGANGTLTREQAAKIIAYMVLGQKAADALSASAAPFKDVAADRWSAGYIAYCVDKGVLLGYGDGNFGPTDELKGYQFAKMLLCAVGYGVNDEYTGNDWSIKVAQDAIPLGIFTGDLSAAVDAPIQRQQAMLMAFNTLTGVSCVKWSALLNTYVNIDYTYTGTPSDLDENLLAENFGLDAATVYDDYGYKGHVWYVGPALRADKANVVSEWYMDDIVVASTPTLSGMTGNAIYKAYTWADTVAVTVNGEPQGTITPLSYKGNGSKVLAAYSGATFNMIDRNWDGYVDNIIVVIEYFGEVTAVAKATANTERKITVKVYNREAGPADATVYMETEDFARGDFVAIIPDGNSSITGQTIEPLYMEKLTPVTTTVTQYNAYSVTTADGVFYNAFNADLVGYNFGGATYDFYFNANGNVIGSRLNRGGRLNYAYLVQSSSIDPDNSLITGADGLVKVKLAYPDGSTEVLAYKVSVAIAPITVNGTTTKGDNLLPGDYYLTYSDASATYYVKVDAEHATGALNALGSFPADGAAVSYVKNDDGTVSLSTVTSKTVGAIPYAVNTTAAVTVKGNVGDVIGAASAKLGYASAGTNLVVVGATGTVTTTTGYANFPAAGVTYTVGTNCTAIFYLTTGTTVTDIVVLTARSAAPDALIAIYNGQSYVGEKGTYYGFNYGENTVFYPLASAPVPGYIYLVSFSAPGVVSSVDHLTGTVGTLTVVDGLTVTANDATYLGTVKGGIQGAYYYTANTAVYYYDTVNKALPVDTVLPGDTAAAVYYTVGGVNYLAAVIILAHA